MTHDRCSVALGDNSRCKTVGKLRRGMCEKHYCRWIRHGDPLAGRQTPGECRSFFEQAMTQTTDECILWPYSLRNGYGQMLNPATGKPEYVHAMACELVHGPRPGGQRYEAAHGPCHNPACFNPRHLRWATCKENSADKWRDGTARGTRRAA